MDDDEFPLGDFDSKEEEEGDYEDYYSFFNLPQEVRIDLGPCHRLD